MIYLFVLTLAIGAPPIAAAPFAGPDGTVIGSSVTGNAYHFIMAGHPTIASCERARRMVVDYALTLDERTFVSKCASARDKVEYRSYWKGAEPAPNPEPPSAPAKPNWKEMS